MEASGRTFPQDAAHSISAMPGFSGDLANGVALLVENEDVHG
jgi:hypothetical protein